MEKFVAVLVVLVGCGTANAALVSLADEGTIIDAGGPGNVTLNIVTDAGLYALDVVATVTGGDVISNIETTNGQTRIETTMQVDYSFGVALKGYSWDSVNGGKSPTDAELATGTNWDKVATDIKHTSGVIAIGDADA